MTTTLDAKTGRDEESTLILTASDTHYLIRIKMGDESSDNEMEPGYKPISAKDSAYQLGKNIEGSSNLFKGIFNQKIPIALKRYKAKDKDSKEYKRNLKLLSLPENRHPNLIRYFGQTVALQKDKKGKPTFK